MQLSVQLCSYNRKATLEKVLRSLCTQSLAPEEYEIVFVDDGSTDGTQEMTAAINFPCAFTYYRQPNSGLAKARNAGISRTQGQYLLFMDDDTIAHKDLLKQHLDWHHKYPRSVVKGWVNHVSNLDNLTEPKFTWADISTAFFWTSNVSVAKEHLLQAGGFSEDFTEYGWEDLELGLRLKNLGLTSRFNKQALVYHYKKPWTKDSIPNMLRQAEAKARTAVIFSAKMPTLRVRLATGNNAPRFWLNRLLYAGGWGERCCDTILAGAEGNLNGIERWCAQQKINFRYFATLEQSLKGNAL